MPSPAAGEGGRVGFPTHLRPLANSLKATLAA